MTTTTLIYRMILRVMAGEPPGELYDEYVKARRLHVSIGEILEAKGEKIA